MRVQRYLFVGFLSLLMVTGTVIDCGKKGPTIEERIKALEDKGVPDSVLTNVKVYLYQYTSAKKGSQAGKARTYKDSLKTGIVQAEGWYQEAMQRNKPFVDSLRKSIVERKAMLSGLPLEDADSLLAVADAFVSKNWLVQARTKFEKFDSIMPIFLSNEEKAKEIRPKIIGTWKDVHTLHAPAESGDKYFAKEVRVFKFDKNSTFESSEECRGQTAPIRKEDWKFISYGKFGLMGDTIYQFIEREKCTRQIYTFRDIKTGKWKKPEEKPTYDSTITDGSKNRFIVYSDLKLQFKKIR